MGVFPPFPRVNHEVAEAGASGRQSLGFPGFNRGGLDDGHKDPFGRVVAENDLRVLVFSHYKQKNKTKTNCGRASKPGKV